MKYDFVYNYTNSPVFDTFVYVNSNVSGLLVYMLVLAFFIVISFVFIKRSDDITLSLTRSLFATTIVSIIFYYMGRNYGIDLFSGSFLIAMILGLVISVSVLYYQRNQVT